MRFKTEIITNYMKEKNLSVDQMAYVCRISKYNLKRLINGDTKVKGRYFLAVVREIGCSCDDFWE